MLHRGVRSYDVQPTLLRTQHKVKHFTLCLCCRRILRKTLARVYILMTHHCRLTTAVNCSLRTTLPTVEPLPAPAHAGAQAYSIHNPKPLSPSSRVNAAKSLPQELRSTPLLRLATAGAWVSAAVALPVRSRPCPHRETASQQLPHHSRP